MMKIKLIKKPAASKPVVTVKRLFTKRQETLEDKDQIDGMKPAVNAHKQEDVPTHNRVAKPSSGKQKPSLSRKKENNVKPKQVKNEKVVPTLFSVDDPIPPGMKLDYFRPNGTPCYVLDLISPGPTVPSKSHPAQAKKRREGS